MILFKKTDYNIKIKENTNHDHAKYMATQESNKLTSAHFAARLAEANLASKNDITNSVKKRIFLVN